MPYEHGRCSSDFFPFGRGPPVRKVSLAGIAALEKGLDEAASLIKRVMSSSLTPIAWTFSLRDAERWIDNARSLVPSPKLDVLELLAKDVERLAQSVQTRVPQYAHFMDDSKYSVPLSKKNVLGHPHRATFGKEAAELHAALLNLGALHREWNMRTPLVEEPTLKDHVEAAQIVWKSAKRATAVVCALSGLHELSGADQAAQITRLNSDVKLVRMPRSLRTAVHNAAQKLGTSPAKKRNAA